MKIRLPEQYQKLPAWQIRMAILHATSYVEDVLGLKDDDKSYASKLQAEAIRFLAEGIEESLTPHMAEYKDNPTTPIARDAFLEQPFFNFEGSFFKQNLPDKEQREKYYKLLRTAVNTLQLVYTGAAFKKKKNDYSFSESDNRTPKTSIEPALIDRYERLFVVTAIMTLIEPLFRLNPEGLDKFLKLKLSGRQKEMNNHKFRSEFIRKVRDAIKKGGISEESLKEIL